jgi:hypothetical protein
VRPAVARGPALDDVLDLVPGDDLSDSGRAGGVCLEIVVEIPEDDEGVLPAWFPNRAVTISLTVLDCSSRLAQVFRRPFFGSFLSSIDLKWLINRWSGLPPTSSSTSRQSREKR